MATFPSFTPTYVGFSKKSQPVKRLVRFADGYEHRVLFGLASHQNPKVFTVQFNESETDVDVIEAFLDSRANDQASFTFTPTGEGTSKTGTDSGNVSVIVSGAKKYVCENWTKTIPYNNRAILSCTFREVFEP